MTICQSFGCQISSLPAEWRGWSPYNYCMNNPLGLVDPDGMEAFNHIVDDNGDEVKITRKEDKSLEFSSNASEDVQTIANAMNLTETGSTQLDAMIASETDIHLKLSAGTKKVKGKYWGGETNPNEKAGSISDSEGNLLYKEVTITLCTGSINQILQDTKEINHGLTFTQAIGIVAGHESVHASDKGEVNADIRYALKYGKNSVRPHQEDKATKVARQIRGEYLK